MSNPRSETEAFSEEEIAKLRTSAFLSDLPEDFANNFIENSKKVVCEPYSQLHHGKSSNPLTLRILIDGCLAIWDESHGEDTIDALITEGQLIGEFELLNFPTHNLEIISLTRSVMAKPDPAALRRLMEASADTVVKSVYLNLSISLVKKLIAQNSILKFRTGSYVQRIAKLCDNFTKDEWYYLTDLPPNEHKNSYTIQLLFTNKVFLGLIEGEDRSAGLGFGTLIQNRVVEFIKYDIDGGNLGVAGLDEFVTIRGKKKKGKMPHCRYFSIKVRDRDKLSEYTLGEKVRDSGMYDES